MRAFVAVDIPEEVRQKLARFVEGVRGFAPDARWVNPASLHITLKFIGEIGEEKVAGVKQALAKVSGEVSTIGFRGTGFFPTVKAARVFWIGVEPDAKLAALAAQVDEALAPLGIAREERAFTPHLTLARTGSGRPQRSRGDRANLSFQKLQEKLGQMPAREFGTMSAREFHLYESKLMAGGAVYAKLQSFALRG
ncbi:MAG TPA: RNA 2',3'-cyclic phosphodiesterase [Terriglobales bacterium]|jgi:2'-5' RNA ligase|nr:RNA 2',3'-cyclic phosphodiesterase [Terriglobales bacterium]